MKPNTATALDGPGTYSDSTSFVGNFNLSIWGTFVGTVTLQRSFDGTTWLDVADYDEPIEDAGYEPGSAIYRIGIKAGDYTSGTANVRIGQ